ncbi:MAG: Re/Si-specific NAD(P)(+) transhydrogenase subunit alpha [Planctomycetes bacterium]|nr:Re/Si-specific NAD(P)(+) transhydrogenase subunit alpha [Planctomycetota bacterium]MBL7007678.1 Re/Si-specific NAD(P)(+) transhydrogenase subunit alpha [Planctomycetota bacterium]
MTIVFVPKESAPGETRVAATPETVAKLVKQGLEPLVERGAGAASWISDEQYAESGARLVDAGEGYGQGDLVLKVAAPSAEEACRIKRGAVLISHLSPTQNLEVVEALRDGGVTAFVMELVPRTTKAQTMDALSSQANIGGYKAVLLAAATLPKYFPLLMTAAGTVKPAKVVIFGVGVAGLQAIATAKRIGAVVWATDIRPEVKEQVESLGGKFIEVAPDAGQTEPSVYAKEASEDYKKRQAEAVAKHVAEADVVITTALIPGRKAPLLITEDMVRSMRPGSVIVDMAVSQGGNCAVSRCGEDVEVHGVKVIGHPNLPATVPVHASQLYARNVLDVVKHLVPDKENENRELRLDFEDEVTAGSIAVHAGEVRHAMTAEALQQRGGS